MRSARQLFTVSFVPSPKGKSRPTAKLPQQQVILYTIRAVAGLLRRDMPDALPWQCILGAGGEIKLRGQGAVEQGFRLSIEG